MTFLSLFSILFFNDRNHGASIKAYEKYTAPKFPTNVTGFLFRYNCNIIYQLSKCTCSCFFISYNPTIWQKKANGTAFGHCCLIIRY